MLVGLIAGLDLPDLDQRLPLFDHRSALTHSVLVPLILASRVPTLAAGLAFGVGVHLLADVFPDAMIGYATVKVPLFGSIGPTASYLWLGANVLACLTLSALVVARLPTVAALAMLLVGSVSGLVYLARTDGGWWALSLLAALGLAARALGRRR